jgi:hypothetical protein
MTAAAIADSGKFFQLTLSDGSHIKFVLNENDAEVQYIGPSK